MKKVAEQLALIGQRIRDRHRELSFRKIVKPPNLIELTDRRLISAFRKYRD